MFLASDLVPPQILPFEFEEKVNTGDTISATCSVNKGDFPIEIFWTLNNRTVDQYGGILVSAIGKRANYMSIEVVDASHAGEFTCHARNPAGTTSYTTELHVNGTF